MARMFNITQLSNARKNEIMRGQGSYTFDFRGFDASRLNRMSTGFSADALRLMADHLVVVHVTNELRAIPVLEQFSDADAVHFTEGSFNYTVIRHVCPRVYSNSLFEYYGAICLECGKTFAVMPAEHVCGEVGCNCCGVALTSADERKAGYCVKCQQSRIESIHSYHGRVFRNAPRFERPDDRETVLHCGAEIEIDGVSRDPFEDEDAKELSRCVNTDFFHPFMEFEHDSSLDGGIECIAAPMTFDGMWRMRDKICAFYDKAVLLDGTFAQANGLHFHIDRDFFGADDAEAIGKASVLIDMMVYKYYDFWMSISRREDGRFGYAEKKEGVDGLYGAFSQSHYQDHCLAVNGSGSRTIELRFFGGHISTGDDFLAAFDIVQAIARWAKGCTLAQAERATPCDIVKYIKKLENVLQFVENVIDERRTNVIAEDARAKFINAIKARIEAKNAKKGVM